MTDIGYFLPARREINTISSASPAVVTTLTAHGYNPGMQIRFTLPITLGNPVLNNNAYFITIIDDFTFSVPSSTLLDAPFVGTSVKPAFVTPVGEAANTLLNAEHNSGTIIPESTFITK